MRSVKDFLPFLSDVPDKFTHVSLFYKSWKIKGQKLTVAQAGMVMTVLKRLDLVERQILYAKGRTIGKWRRKQPKEVYNNQLVKIRKKYVYA